MLDHETISVELDSDYTDVARRVSFVNPALPSPCRSKMPLGGPPLTTNEVDLIESWVAAGALNN